MLCIDSVVSVSSETLYMLYVALHNVVLCLSGEVICTLRAILFFTLVKNVL